MRICLLALLAVLLQHPVSWSQETYQPLHPHSEQIESTPAQIQLEQQLRGALALSDSQRALLQDLRQALQEQLASIRLQVESDGLDETEARWQVKMALASHRQGRAALLSSDQVTELQNIYNPRGEEDAKAVTLRLSLEQQERIRSLIRQQQQEWQALDEAAVAPTLAERQALRQEHRLGFERILTRVQIAALQFAKEQRRRHHGLEAEITSGTSVQLDDAPEGSAE